MKVLELLDIHRAFVPGTPVLKGLTVSVGRGEVVGLLGRNGAGKTTLLRIVMGMIHPQRGTVRVFGLDPWKQPIEIKRRVGYVSEEQILPGSSRVEEVIQLHRGLFPTWDDAMDRDLRERFALPAGKRIRDLSKGQARQVALLCAVAHRPELLVLDEPAGGLDAVSRREFLETAVELLNEAGSTILFSTHQMQDVERLAERVVLLRKGELRLDAPLDRIQEGYTLASLPALEPRTRRALCGLGPCVSVREHAGAVRALFSSSPAETKALLFGELGLGDASCVCAPLEDLFIELVIAADGAPPAVTTPWGESFVPHRHPIWWGRAPVLYNPYDTAANSSPRFVAFQLARAVRDLYGVSLSPEKIERRCLKVSETIGVSGDPKALARLIGDASSLEPPRRAQHLALRALWAIGLWAFLTGGLLWSLGPPSFTRRQNRLRWGGIVVFGLLSLGGLGLVFAQHWSDRAMQRALFAIAESRAAALLPGSAFWTWVGVAAFASALYLLLLRRFASIDVPPKGNAFVERIFRRI